MTCKSPEARVIRHSFGAKTKVGEVYQETETPAPGDLFSHIFGEQAQGWLVTFTGQQARFSRPGARPNELAGIRQQSFSYPAEADHAATYLLAESERRRDAYFGSHLFREPGNRLASNASTTVRSLWLDEDEGRYPSNGPEPTAIVSSSATRRHLYWRLSRPVAIEWAVAMNRRIAAWSDGDTGKAAAASVLRAPGTMNYKRHPQVDPVRLEITGAAPWEPEVMEQAIPEGSGEPSRPQRTEPYDGPKLELEEFVGGVEVLGSVPDGGGTKLAIVCPWANEHTSGDRTGTYVGQYRNGALWFHCHHEHCQGRSWRDFRRQVRPRGTVSVFTRSSTPTGKVVIRFG